MAGPTAGSRCKLTASHQAAQVALRDRWALVVGDSRVRFIYAALLKLVNGSLPSQGWPTHRVPDGDACTPHVPAHDGLNATHGWFDRNCVAVWKGPCCGATRGCYNKNVCVLDYRLPGRGIRLTFLWHSLNEGLYLRALKARLALLYAHAQRAPDLIVGSSTMWDMQQSSPLTSSNCCCDTLTSFARTLCRDHMRAPSNLPGHLQASLLPPSGSLRASSASHPAERRRAPLTVMYGLFNCPSCKLVRRDPNCAHIAVARRVQELTAKTHACGRNVSRAHGMVYLDVQSMTSTVPSLLSSPCIHNHAFGVLAEAQAAAIVGLLRFSRRPPSPPDVTNASFWRAWQPMGTSLRCVVGDHCASRVEPQVRSEAKVAFPAPVQQRSSGWLAGYCRSTTRGGSCTADDHGSWDLPREVQEADTELGSHEVAKAACMDMCRRCANCGYVSVSVLENDCSWFRRCALDRLKQDVAGFMTARLSARVSKR